MIFNMQSLFLIHSFQTILKAAMIFDWYFVEHFRRQNRKYKINGGICHKFSLKDQNIGCGVAIIARARSSGQRCVRLLWIRYTGVNYSANP